MYNLPSGHQPNHGACLIARHVMIAIGDRSRSMPISTRKQSIRVLHCTKLSARRSGCGIFADLAGVTGLTCLSKL
jgi:hypothetical protein